MKRSFTLIEILVSIFLFSLLFSFSILSIKLFIKRSNVVKNVIPKMAMNFDYINISIQGLYPYVLNNYKYYFICKPDELKYITTNSLFYDRMVVVDLKKIDNKLVYSESPLFFKEESYLKPEIIDSNKSSIVIFNNLEKFSVKCFYDKGFIDFIEININDFEFLYKVFSNWSDLNETFKKRGQIY